MHLYSRSRDEIWHKGATSGHFQRVTQLRYDCDGDAIVALVEPAGPACHTGERSCFYRDLEGTAEVGRGHAPPAPGEPVPVPFEALWRGSSATWSSASANVPRAATRSSCWRIPSLAASKVKEEAAEVDQGGGRANPRSASPRRCADVIYHLAVLLLSRGISMAEVLQILNGSRKRAPTAATAPQPGLEPGPRARPGACAGRQRHPPFASPSSTTPRRRSAPSSSCELTAPVFPARVGRAGPPRPLVVPRLPPAIDSALESTGCSTSGTG